MIKYLYSIYDAAAQSYGDPIIFASDAVAARSFQIESQNSDSVVAKFPTDFTVFCIGEFDTVSGNVSPVNKVICRGTDFINKE